jgi:hypothetical protein
MGLANGREEVSVWVRYEATFESENRIEVVLLYASGAREQLSVTMLSPTTIEAPWGQRRRYRFDRQPSHP